MTETRLTMTLRGLALDHPALIQFIRTVEDSREFGKVELVRATREPYRSGLAVMFELRCPVEGGR
jgi:hypothetical protein